MNRTVFAVMLLVGIVCACSRRIDPQEQCVGNMERLWDACRSYHLSEGISPTQAIAPRSLNVYFRPQDLDMRCPLGTNAYTAFSYQEGPECPNSEEHTRTLRNRMKSE